MSERLVLTSRARAWGPAAAVSIGAAVVLGVVFAARGELSSIAVVLRLLAVLGVVLVVGAYLATARLAVIPEGIVVGVGGGGRQRLIPSDEIANWQMTQVSLSQVFGIGLPLRLRTTRCLVRSGPALRIDLRNGERIWVSVSDEAGAERMLSQTLSDSKGEGAGP